MASPAAANYISTFRVLDLPYSGHFPILTNLTVKSHCNSANLFTKAKIVLPTDKSELLAIGDLMAKKIEDSLEQTLSAAETAKCLTNTITSVCHELGLIKPPREITNRPKWFDKECKEAKFVMNQALRTFRRTFPHKTVQRKGALQKYKDAAKLYKDLCDLKYEQRRQEAEDAICDAKTPISYCRAIKSLRRPVATRTQKSH